MFDDYDSDLEDIQTRVKKTKRSVDSLESKSELVHSSLEYHSIKVPPIVEYKAIDDYCEKRGQECAAAVGSLRSVSSPVVLRSPQPRSGPASAFTQHYCFFSVEELTLVTDLKNWTNKRVCPVGKTSYTEDLQECFLKSVEGNSKSMIYLNLNLLEKNPEAEKLVQIFGDVFVDEGRPKISVFFIKYLGSVDVSLFVESYKFMQKFIPRSVPVFRFGSVEEQNVMQLDGNSEVCDVDS